jgi:hypothetical protein
MRIRGLLALVLWTACADDAPPGPEPLPAGCSAFVSDSLIEHACFHAQVGPHHAQNLDGSASWSIERPHTAFQLQLEARAGQLGYRARESGRYAFFTRDVARLRVWQGSRELTPAVAHQTELCAELPQVVVFELAAGSYRITLEGEADRVLLVPEQVEGERLVCGLDAGARPSPVERDAGVCQLDPVLEHSCLHVQHGPFVAVRADEQAPAVDAAHTVHHVQYAGGPLTFTPARDGEFVFYLGDARVLVLRGASGTVPWLAEEDVLGCSGLARAHVAALRAGTPYRLQLAEGTVSEVTLLIESVTTFSPAGWAARFEPCTE